VRETSNYYFVLDEQMMTLLNNGPMKTLHGLDLDPSPQPKYGYGLIIGAELDGAINIKIIPLN
jgi:hypothetical protein